MLRAIGWCYCLLGTDVKTYFRCYFILLIFLFNFIVVDNYFYLYSWKLYMHRCYNAEITFIHLFIEVQMFWPHYDVMFILFLYLLHFPMHRCYSAEVVIYLFSILEWNTIFYPKMCGRLYFPMFLFNVGLFTLMYMASLIALAILWPSLPMILKFSTGVVWPVLLWCSNIGDGAFKCSLYLSPNVLDDFPMYSSSQSILSHLNQ